MYYIWIKTLKKEKGEKLSYHFFPFFLRKCGENIFLSIFMFFFILYLVLRKFEKKCNRKKTERKNEKKKRKIKNKFKINKLFLDIILNSFNLI